MATKHKKDSGAQRRRSKSSLSKSGKYFRENPKAAKKKDKYNRDAKRGKTRNYELSEVRNVEQLRKLARTSKAWIMTTQQVTSSKAAINRGRKGEGNR